MTGRLGEMVAKHQAMRALMARVQAGEGTPLSPDAPPGALQGFASPARAGEPAAPGLSQAPAALLGVRGTLPAAQRARQGASMRWTV